ncbi:MAG: NAD(P)H-dependent oxidoreductase [Cyanobacteria bacterium P01_F01_bin.150]
MGYAPKILAFAGSARRESFNKRLLAVGVNAAHLAGAEVTVVDFADYPMPLFNEDEEARLGLPQTVVQFKGLLRRHQGLLLACPEYNGSITPLLKNALDWASRPDPGDTVSCFQGKVAALLATSPGALGGLRGLVHVRAILSHLGVMVIPQQKAIPRATQAFNPDGSLMDKSQQQSVSAIAQQLVDVTSRLS